MNARRSPFPTELVECPVIAVLRAPAVADLGPVVDTLLDSGLTAIELTLSTSGLLAALPTLVGRWGSAIGVGTITTVDDAHIAIEAGISFMVTPVSNADIVECANESQVPVFPGAMTPTEVLTMWNAGATAVKLFPAQTFGPTYGSHLRGPFADLQFVPSGGIGLDDVGDWLRAGAAAVSVGGPLIRDAFAGGSLGELAKRARNFVERAAGVSER